MTDGVQLFHVEMPGRRELEAGCGKASVSSSAAGGERWGVSRGNCSLVRGGDVPR